MVTLLAVIRLIRIYIVIQFNNGHVTYRSAFLRSDQITDSLNSGRLMISGFAGRYSENKPKHVSVDGQKVKTSNANINLEKIGGRFVALGETPLPIEFKPETLNTIGIFDYKYSLKKAPGIWECAHFKPDPVTGLSK